MAKTVILWFPLSLAWAMTKVAHEWKLLIFMRLVFYCCSCTETFQQATIMFSDIVGFTNIAATCPPEAIVNMLNDMYERFDRATNSWDVYKVIHCVLHFVTQLFSSALSTLGHFFTTLSSQPLILSVRDAVTWAWEDVTCVCNVVTCTNHCRLRRLVTPTWL